MSNSLNVLKLDFPLKFLFVGCAMSEWNVMINPGVIVLVLILSVLFATRYLVLRKTGRRLWHRYREALREREVFLKSFNPSSFEDFSAFDFGLGHFSHVSPFPKQVGDEWRFRIYLSGSEAEDLQTIVHEISECTIGRLIEKLLNLKKPLYLQRKEDDKFWLHGKRQRYLVEHVVTTLGEAEELNREKLFQRLEKEDAETWLN